MSEKRRGFAHIAAAYLARGDTEEAHQLARHLLPWAKARALEEDDDKEPER